MRFSDEVAAAFPAANPMPSLLRQAIELMEAHGCVRTLRSGARYMTLHPEPEFSDISTTSIHVPDPTDTRAWTNSDDPAVNERLVIFLRTGGAAPGRASGWTMQASSASSTWGRAPAR